MTMYLRIFNIGKWNASTRERGVFRGGTCMISAVILKLELTNNNGIIVKNGIS